MDSPNRKLFRPSFGEARNDSRDKSDMQRKGAPQKRPSPAEQTNAENFYYVKQMQAKTPMAIVLQDGEVVRGVIEWYDRTCLKVNRVDQPNILIYKHNIKYLHKDETEE